MDLWNWEKELQPTVVGTFLSPSGLGIPAISMGISTGMEGIGKIGSSVFAPDKELGIAVNPIKVYFGKSKIIMKQLKNLVIMGTTIAAQSKYNNFLEKTTKSPKSN